VQKSDFHPSHLWHLVNIASLLYMYRQRTNPQESPKAVHYFQHFPSNFLRPYGPADSQPAEATLMRRIVPLNWKWLLRPKVAASEFAQTIDENLDMLTKSESKFIKPRHFKSMQITQPRSQGFRMRTRRGTRKPWSGPVNFAFWLANTILSKNNWTWQVTILTIQHLYFYDSCVYENVLQNNLSK
jgi:hypothetical protein